MVGADPCVRPFTDPCVRPIYLLCYLQNRSDMNHTNHHHHHHRRSIRLHRYNYAQNGMYFVTICIQNHLCLLGEIRNHVMVPNNACFMINKWWDKIPGKFSDIILDEFIIMPNHFHAIVINNGSVGADPCVCPITDPCVYPTNTQTNDLSQTHDISQSFGIEGEHMGSPLHRVIQWFKTMTTNEYIRNVKSIGWKPFDVKLWQRNFYEHVIRDFDSYIRIKNYIRDNPVNW